MTITIKHIARSIFSRSAAPENSVVPVLLSFERPADGDDGILEGRKDETRGRGPPDAGLDDISDFALERVRWMPDDADVGV